MDKDRAWLIMAIVILTGVLAVGISILDGSGKEQSATLSNQKNETGSFWRTAVMRDVVSGEEFSVDQFGSKRILVLTFTVSCPVCTAQQREISALISSGKQDFTFVALDIDPYETADAVLSHVRRNGFSGHYAIAPVEVTGSLVRDFGMDVATPASAPAIVICPGGRARLFSGGLKNQERLQGALAGCADE
jgi:cytochrome oxidase Cu insertion factor (SCO1/SenC/PrrC family)